jgi:transposase
MKKQERSLQSPHQVGLEFIAKNENAPNVPQARPIEKFWAICKAKYKKNNVKAEDIKILGFYGENIIQS